MVERKIGTFLFLLKVLVLVAAGGTAGGSVNQWNRNSNPQQFPQTKGAPLGGWDDEVNNPRGTFPGGSPMWKIEDAIPGVPGQSYPSYDKIPQTAFDCRQQMFPGYYADVEAQCQVFHICQSDGRQNSFLCPLGTIFNQETFVCDWWFNVNCADSPQHALRNDNLYKSPYLGIDGLKTPSYARRQDQGAVQEKGVGQNRRGQESGTSGGGGQGGNFQLSAVGTPNFDSQTRGRQWPSDQQGQSGSGNVKGDGRNVNQVPNFRNSGPSSMGNRPSRMNQKGGVVSGPNVANRNPNNVAAGPNRINSGANQKGSRGQNRNAVWNQQGAHPRRNEKGGSYLQSPGNSVWSQARMRNANRGMKGQMWNSRQSLMQGGNLGAQGNRRMGPNEGFDVNRWSVTPQNFKANAQDAVGGSDEAWPNNFNRGKERENFPAHPKGQHNQELKDNIGPIIREDNSWINNGGDFPRWNEDALKAHISQGRHSQGFVSNHVWNSENRFDKESSWQTNDQYRNNHAVDYDY